MCWHRQGWGCPADTCKRPRCRCTAQPGERGRSLKPTQCSCSMAVDMGNSIKRVQALRICHMSFSKACSRLKQAFAHPLRAGNQLQSCCALQLQGAEPPSKCPPCHLRHDPHRWLVTIVDAPVKQRTSCNSHTASSCSASITEQCQQHMLVARTAAVGSTGDTAFRTVF